MSIETHFGDCLTVLPTLTLAGKVDFILTDLPYGTTNCDWDCPIDLPSLWEQYWRVLKPNGAIVLFAQTPFDKVLGSSCLEYLRYEWIWEKTNATGHLNANRMPMKAHENILVFYKKLPTYNPQKTTGHTRKISTIQHRRNSKQSNLYNKNTRKTGYDSTERYPRDVLLFPSDKQTNKLHETQKPVALCEYFINTYTNPGELVLDSCAGSGTTGEAAYNTGRNCILIENKKSNYTKMTYRMQNLL